MDVEDHTDDWVCRAAAAIAEPARARMLYCLLDNRARTSTELAIVADVSPSTASAHLNRLRTERLVGMIVQGKHRYYSLGGADVANVLESLSVLTGRCHQQFVPRTTPKRLVAARTCYDHIAGTLGVLLHDRLMTLGWLSPPASGNHDSYEMTAKGMKMFELLGIDVDATWLLRRRFAFPCLDWSERRAHLGGAMGAAMLKVALKNGWVTQDLDSRTLCITRRGQREIFAHFGFHV